MLYPLKFKPILKTTLWGGTKLAAKSESPGHSRHIGESWEISAVQDNLSVVSEGPLAENTLEELVEVYMGDLVGDRIYEKFGIEFPLLIKFIDAQDDLSIQVHPDDATAKARHRAYGKTEMWYVAEAEPGACIRIGFQSDTDRATCLAYLQQQRLPELLHNEPVKKGDCFLVQPGTVHAIGKGCLILEISQTSDITYRLDDYRRTDSNGRQRELHTDLAADIIRTGKEKAYALPYRRHANHTAPITDCDYFTAHYLKFNQEIEKDYFELDSFVIYVCLEGKFTLAYDTDRTVQVHKGETVLVPACLKSLFLLPQKEAEILEIYCEPKQKTDRR